MTPKVEQYVHLEECIRSLDEAWGILHDIQATTLRTAIQAAAYRYALVAYARPYTRSDGEHKKGRDPYVLPTPTLTPEDEILHQRILDLRKHVLAHSDINVKKANVYVGRYGGRAHVCIASNSLPDFPAIDAVINLIERTLDLLNAQRTQDEDELAPEV